MNRLIFFFTCFFFLSDVFGYTCNSKARELIDRYKNTGTFRLSGSDPLILSGACYNLTNYAHSPFLPNHMVMLVYPHQGNVYYTGRSSMQSKANGFKNLDLEGFGRLDSRHQEDRSVPFDTEDYLREIVERGHKATPLTEREAALCSADKMEKQRICQSTQNLSPRESVFCQASDGDREEKIKEIDLCLIDRVTDKQALWSVGGFSYQRLGFDGQGMPIFVFTSIREMFHCELIPHPIAGDSRQGEVDESCQP